jgi:hypothetical protein
MAIENSTQSASDIKTDVINPAPLDAEVVRPYAPRWWGQVAGAQGSSALLAEAFDAMRKRVGAYGDTLWDKDVDPETSGVIGEMLCNLASEASTFLDLWEGEQAAMVQAASTKPSVDVDRIDRVGLACRFRKAATDFLPAAQGMALHGAFSHVLHGDLAAASRELDRLFSAPAGAAYLERPARGLDQAAASDLVEYLASAYRSHLQLTHMLVGVYHHITAPPRGEYVDLGWQVETMRDIAMLGTNALTSAAERLGLDESALTRFMDDQDAEAMIRHSRTTSGN